MKISFAIQKTEIIDKKEVEMVRGFGQDEYIERSEFVNSQVTELEWLSDKSFEKDLFSLSCFLSEAESDDNILVVQEKDGDLIIPEEEDSGKTLQGLLEVYRVMIADPDNNPQSLIEASKRCVDKQMTFVESTDSILYDESTSDFVQRKDFAGLLKQVETERTSIVESDNTFRSKIVALARIGGEEIVKLNEKGTKWVFQTKSQMWNQLVKLCEGTKINNDGNKGLKNIILGSQSQFDDIYRAEGLNPTEKGDWTDVMIIGQSLNKVSSPMLDKDMIAEVVPKFRKLRKGELSDDEVSALGIDLKKSNQKRAVNYLAQVSNGNTLTTQPADVKSLETKLKRLKKERDEKEKAFNALLSNIDETIQALEQAKRDEIEKESKALDERVIEVMKSIRAEDGMSKHSDETIKIIALGKIAEHDGRPIGELMNEAKAISA